MAHPAVLEAAAVGVPHEVKGEVIVVFVRLRPGETDDPDLRRAVSDKVVEQMGKALTPGGRVRRQRSAANAIGQGHAPRGARRVPGLDPGDLSALENPLAVESIRSVAQAT